MLNLPAPLERIPVRRCYLVLDGRRCFGEILHGQAGNVVFIDPDHPNLARQKAWEKIRAQQQQIYDAFDVLGFQQYPRNRR